MSNDYDPYVGTFKESPLDMKSIQRLHPEQAMLALASEFFGYRERTNKHIADLERQIRTLGHRVHELEVAVVDLEGDVAQAHKGGKLAGTVTATPGHFAQPPQGVAGKQGLPDGAYSMTIDGVPPGAYINGQLLDAADKAMKEACGVTESMTGLKPYHDIVEIDQARTVGFPGQVLKVRDGFRSWADYPSPSVGSPEWQQSMSAHGEAHASLLDRDREAVNKHMQARAFADTAYKRAQRSINEIGRSMLDGFYGMSQEQAVAAGLQLYDGPNKAEIEGRIDSLRRFESEFPATFGVKIERTPEGSTPEISAAEDGLMTFKIPKGSPGRDLVIPNGDGVHSDLARKHADDAAGYWMVIDPKVGLFDPTKAERAIEILSRPNMQGINRIKPAIDAALKEERLAAPLSMAALSHARKPL